MQISENQIHHFVFLRKWQSGFMNMFHRMILCVEAESTSIISCIFTFVACVLLRNFLEGFTGAADNLFNADSLVVFISLGHMDAFNISVALSLTIAMHYVTKAPIIHVLKIVLSGFILLCIAPTVDYIFPQGNVYGYTYFSNFENYSLILSYLTFYGQFTGITIGMKVEIFIGLIGIFLYGYDKTQCYWKAIFGYWLAYTIIFMFLSSQFILKGMFDLIGLFYMPTNFGFLALFFITTFLLGLWVSFLMNKTYFIALVREIPIMRVLNFEIMFLLGICAAFQADIYKFKSEILSNPSILIYFTLLVIASFMAFVFVMVINNLEDVEIDKISNSDRAVVAGKISKLAYSNIAYSCLGLSLLYSAPVGAQAVFFMLLFMGIYYIYSAYPLRMKRITIISKLAISGNSLLLFLLGYWLVKGDFSVFYDNSMNIRYVVAMFLLFTLAANFIDLKDVDGDKVAGIKTLPVVIGMRKAQYFCGLTFLLSYVLMGLNFSASPILLGCCVLGGVVQFYLLTRKQYNEAPVLFLYIISLLLLLVFACLTREKIALSMMAADEQVQSQPGSIQSVSLSEEEIHSKKIAALITNYNVFFKTSFNTIDQLKPDALERVKKFYTAVRNCTPGTYQYISQYIPGVVFYTSVIEGIKSGECLVESTYTIPHISEGTKTCKFTPATQLLFTDEQAAHDGSGKFHFDQENLTAFQRGEMSDCRITTKLLTKQ